MNYPTATYRKNKMSITTILVLSLIVLLACSSNDDVSNNDDTQQTQDCTNTASVFTINLDPSACNVDIEDELNATSQYQEVINGTTRTVTINGIAGHNVGMFPNSGNPNTIDVVNESYTMTTDPQLATSTTGGQGYTTAILFSGVVVEPYTAEFFVGTSGTNMNWNITTLQSTTSLGLDCNNAHVQPTGRYHYHGTPSAYLDDLVVDGTQMVKVGYSADGFPIYYKYGYADDGTTIIAHESGYQLKTEDRGGDGLTAPDGCPDGYYFQDYEYSS
ncbi:MAG: YHYH protein [Proteobacteria bacterium]|nr:YHYH protein [Pseudomonadota bacterium]